MEKLTVKLKQHTPLIHFQHYQENPTLRASEVKPRLDRYILETLGNGNYKDGCNKAKSRHWIIGNNALNYKLRIKPIEKKRISLCENFPLVLSNMGRKNKDAVGFSMYKDVDLIFFISDEALYEKISKHICQFIMNNNFAQRDSKGFGSFVVIEINGNPITNYMSYIGKDTLYADFSINKIKDDFLKYKTIFNVISGIWKIIKKNSNGKYTKNICDYKSYIAFMKLSRRVPAPIIFKPILYTQNKTERVSIFIMPDKELIARLIEDYPKNNEKLHSGFTVSADKMNNIKNIQYIYSMFSKNEKISDMEISFKRKF